MSGTAFGGNHPEIKFYIPSTSGGMQAGWGGIPARSHFRKRQGLEFAQKLHSPDGQGNVLLLPGERRRKAAKQGSAVFDRLQMFAGDDRSISIPTTINPSPMTAIISFHYNGTTNPIILPRRPSSTTPDDPNRPIASRGYYSTITNLKPYGEEDLRKTRDLPRFSGCMRRLFTIPLLLSPLAGLFRVHAPLLVRSLKRYNPDNPDTAMSSWRHIRWSLCRGDKLVVRIFEFKFVLYDSSPQLTNTGFLIGDIVGIHPLVSLIRLISELRTSSQEYPATSPASPSPFGTAIVTIRYVTNPHFRVDEKEGNLDLTIIQSWYIRFTIPSWDVELAAFVCWVSEYTGVEGSEREFEAWAGSVDLRDLNLE
ncbi:hypothetical protein C8J56DRAFT_903674 [Mycena floridula]|nr:hypothetical protein C8J56DRAFT_903674 [Mycena floridula]